jgi:tripartite-type tricarboxylate transporter receptor subunit TctC
MKAGRIQLMFDPLVLPQSSDGRIKTLAVISKERLPGVPDVPTIKEAGGPDLTLTAWFGLFGPARMPPDVVAKLEAATKTVMNDPENRKRLHTLGLTPNVMTGQEFRRAISSDLKVYADIKEKAKLTVE